jgi:hypothetical protein
MPTPSWPAILRHGCFWGLLALALAVHVADFPPRYQLRNLDERPYVEGGFALWEGITPTYKYSPAGPQTWISWGFAAVESARDYFQPSPRQQSAPFVLRPFMAGSRALFDLYHDWSIPRWVEVGANVAIAIAAVAAGFGLGFKRGGLPGALLVGGLTAFLPIFIDLGDEARPYVMAWGMGIIALYYSASSPTSRASPRASAVWMGLSIATRIDMVLLFPLALADLWEPGERVVLRLGRLVRYVVIALVVMQLVSPWVLTNLVGNLRIIATVRLAEPATGPVPISQTIYNVMIGQGLIVAILLVAAAVIWAQPPRVWLQRGVAVYALLLALTMLKATEWGLQHQGGPLVVLIVASGIGAAAAAARWPRWVWPAVAVGVILPAFQTARFVLDRRDYVPAPSTEWVNTHVVPGTRVYMSEGIHDPLPTRVASDALWNEVADPDAWMKKESNALQRFSSATSDFPRAFSEENMIVERGIRREWFILGDDDSSDPRFDIRVFTESPVFGIKADPASIEAAYKSTGGILIAPANYDDALGPPIIEWLNSKGDGVRIYCSSPSFLIPSPH